MQPPAMATNAPATQWMKGVVKAVPSGDTLLIMACSKAELPREKTITLTYIIAPRLARHGGTDEPFAWQSREFLRTLCIGKDVTFSSDYLLRDSSREFGRVYVGDHNVADLVVAAGFARVKEQGRHQRGGENPYVATLRKLELTAENQGLGLWSKEPGAAKEAVRDLPPPAMGEASGFDARGFVDENKGKSLKAIVEQVRDGSTIRVHLLPSFLFAQIYVAGVQAPSMGRRPIVCPNALAQTQSEATGEDVAKGDASAETPALAVGQKIATSASLCGSQPDRFGREAKHFTETRVLSREVRIVVEGSDSFQNIFGSVYYADGDIVKDLALNLVENGFAKFVEWSARMLDIEAKIKLKNAELQAKKEQLRIWTGFVPPATSSKPIHNQKFTGKVVEVVSGCCIIVADDAGPYGSPAAERRVNLSSIRSPKLENPLPFARAAKEFLRTRLIGKQVHVSMEFSRRMNVTDGHISGPKTNSADARVLHYGSVFLSCEVEGNGTPPGDDSGDSHQHRVNVAEMLLSRGFADIIRHRDYEERSHCYDALLIAHARAEKGKKGYHSNKDYPMTHMTDLTMAPAKKARDFLNLLQGNKKHSAVVEHVFSGHRFKVTIPKETCTIAFSFSGVRCPGKNEAYSDEAIALMRRRILQRDVEIEIETVDRTGTFLGSLRYSKINMASVLLEAGLAKISSPKLDTIPDGYALSRAERSAKQKKLKVWENYEGEKIGDERLAYIEQPLASLQVKDPLETLEAKDHLSESSENKGPPGHHQKDSPYLFALVNGKKNNDASEILKGQARDAQLEREGSIEIAEPEAERGLDRAIEEF